MKNFVAVLLVVIFIPDIVFTQHRCFTPELLSSPSSQSFLKTTGKRFSPNQIFSRADTASIQSFFVRNIFNQSKWGTVTAQKIFSSAKVILWLDTALVKSFFTANEKDSLRSSFKRNLLFSTSNYSVNPSKGILDLEHEYFGLPPNVDGDGVLDILLFDIKDGYPSSGSYIAGFFDPNDLVNSSTSNKRDLLYIDVYPLIKEGTKFSPDAAMSTIAHEYQHLIHAHYERGESEYVFINEGLSEFAEIFCGFEPRSGLRYAQSPDRSLFHWSYSDPIPDYSRASLWTEYLFEQLGYQYIKPFVQSPKVGMNAINELLSLSTNLSFQQTFTNWTLANFINDVSYSPAYSYKHPLRRNFHLQSQYSNDTLPSVNSVIIPSSSCYIVQYPFVEQLIVEPSRLNSSLSFSALTFHPNGTKSVLPLLASDILRITALPNSNTTVQLLIRNVQTVANETDASSIPFSYLARGKKSGREMQFVYDDGIADPFNNNARYLLIDSSESVGISFVHIREGWLKGISVKCIFLSEIQGSGVPQKTERDINVQIFSSKNGLPDLPLTMKKHHSFQRAQGVLDFEKIPLDEFYIELSALKDTFCVVISNDSDDSNYFAIGLDNLTKTYSSITETDTITQTIYWTSFNSKSIQDSSLAHWNAMIRCNSIFPLESTLNDKILFIPDFTYLPPQVTMSLPFSIDILLSRCIIKTPNGNYFVKDILNQTQSKIEFQLDGIGNYTFTISLYSNEGFMVLDTTVSYNFIPEKIFNVSNNFPNPFNSQTTIVVTLFMDSDIELQLYNIVGQKIQFVNLKNIQVGKHSILLDLSRYSSGTYFIRTIFKSNSKEGYTETKKILLVK